MALSPPSKTQTVAAIDVGSNAIRMVVAQIDETGRVQTLENLQRAVPLGEDSFPTGHIERETINLAIEVLRGYQKIMEPYHVDRLRAVATSAVREALNQDVFLERVYMSTGINVEVVTGSEEARLLYAAVLDAFQNDRLPPEDMSLIVELGSGSAQLSMFHENKVVFSGTYALGTIRLRKAVSPAHRAPVETVDLIKRFILPSIDVIEHGSPLREIRHFVGVGGDVRFAADQIAKDAGAGARVKTIKRGDFLRFAAAMGKLSAEEVSKKYSLPYQDCDTLGPALLTYAELLRRTPAKAVRVPYVSMRDGILLDFVAENTGRGLDELEEQMFSSAEHIGQRYQHDVEHARHVAFLACQMFDLLADEHRLGRRERRLLKVAALLHEVGMYISNRSHHKHTEYVVNNSDVFGLRVEDRSVAACVARYHRRSLPKTTHANYMALNRADRTTVSKLAALLRVADALDRSHTRKVKDLKVELRRDEAILHVETGEDLTLERLAMRGKGDMFEEVFGKKIILQS